MNGKVFLSNIFLLVALTFICWSQRANAQDYIGMAVQYGNNMQNILHTEIMNDAGHNAINQATGKSTGPTTSKPKAAWPRHITENSINGYTFTVTDLADMHDNL